MLSLSDRIRVALNEDASHNQATIGDLRRIALLIAEEVEQVSRSIAVKIEDGRQLADQWHRTQSEATEG